MVWTCVVSEGTLANTILLSITKRKISRKTAKQWSYHVRE